MPITDNRTANLNLPLPSNLNQLEDDVTRLRSALTSLDTLHTFAALLSKPTTVSGFGITDAYTKTQSDGLITSLVNGAPANLNTLGEIATQLQTDEAAHAGLVATYNSHVSSGQHAVATGSVAGFMSAADKTKVDAFNGAMYLPASNMVNVTPTDYGAVVLGGNSADGSLAMVNGYGIYQFVSASTEIADGETCVNPSAGGGKWLLIAPSWDFVWANISGVIDNVRNLIATIPVYVPPVVPTILFRTVNVTTPDWTNSWTGVYTVSGASVGDLVVIQPPVAFTNGANYWHDEGAWVSATNQVTFRFSNWNSAYAATVYAFNFIIIKP